MKRFLFIPTLMLLGACASKAPIKPGLKPTEFFEADFASYVESIGKNTEHDGLLRAFPPILALRDPQPLRIRRPAAGVPPVLAPFDRADRAPWWWDLVRIETGALLLASERSLKDYREGACVESYARAYGEMGGFLSPDPSGPESSPLPFPDSRRPSNPEEIARWDEWKRTPEGAHPGLVKAFERVMPEGVTLAGTRQMPDKQLARFLATSSDRRVVEFRQLERGGEEWKSGCDRFLKAARLYQPGTEFKCLFTNGQSYASEFWAPGSSAPVAEDVKDGKMLAAHLRWMCRELASAHARQIELARLREIHLSLREGKPLGSRLTDYARREAARTLESWRASLK